MEHTDVTLTLMPPSPLHAITDSALCKFRASCILVLFQIWRKKSSTSRRTLVGNGGCWDERSAFGKRTLSESATHTAETCANSADSVCSSGATFNHNNAPKYHVTPETLSSRRCARSRKISLRMNLRICSLQLRWGGGGSFNHGPIPIGSPRHVRFQVGASVLGHTAEAERSCEVMFGSSRKPHPLSALHTEDPRYPSPCIITTRISAWLCA